MKLFIDNTGKVLCSAREAIQFGHPWGDLQAKGEATWLDVPEGEHVDDCTFVARPTPRLVVDAAKSAARKAEERERAQRKAALDAIDYTTPLSEDDRDLVARAWLAERKGK
jgi:hypothetical protein